MTEGLRDGLARLARLLEALAAPAAVIGGIAVIARVGTRATRDVDVLVALDPTRIEAALATASALGYAFDEQQRALWAEGLCRLYPAVDGPTGFGVDLLLADAPYLRRAVARASPVDLGGVSLPVVAVEDLAVLKLEAGRPLDLEDVLAIRDACPDLDVELIRREAGALGVGDRAELYFPPAPPRS